MSQNSNNYRINPDQIAMLWSGWHEGLSNHKIAKLIGIKPPSVFQYLAKHGGIEPRARKRRDYWLTQEEREEISRELACGTSLRQIARDLNRSPSTISREVERNGGADEYRAEHAEYRASEFAKRPKLCKLALAGSKTLFLMMRICACLTKRFTKLCLFSPEVYLTSNYVII